MPSDMNLESGEFIDLDSLKARCLGNLQIVERVLGKFRTQLDIELEALEAALAAHDVTTFCAVAHRLKGMSANVEAWPLHDCAKEVGELALTEEMDELAVHLERIHELRTQLAAVLDHRQATAARDCRGTIAERPHADSRN